MIYGSRTASATVNDIRRNQNLEYRPDRYLVEAQLDEGSDPVSETYTVSGTVRDEVCNPEEGVDIYASHNDVTVSGVEVKTDSEGKWSFPGSRPGAYNFRAIGPDWYNASLKNDVEASSDFSDVDFTLSYTTTQISVTVWDSKSLGKVSDAHVEVWTQDEPPVLLGEDNTSSQGAIPQISVKGKLGTYTVKATASGYLSASR